MPKFALMDKLSYGMIVAGMAKVDYYNGRVTIDATFPVVFIFGVYETIPIIQIARDYGVGPERPFHTKLSQFRRMCTSQRFQPGEYTTIFNKETCGEKHSALNASDMLNKFEFQIDEVYHDDIETGVRSKGLNLLIINHEEGTRRSYPLIDPFNYGLLLANIKKIQRRQEKKILERRSTK